MDTTHLDHAKPYDPENFAAGPILKGGRTTGVVIRLLPGQQMPGHNHGEGDLMLYAVEGTATLDVGAGPVDFPTGSLAHLDGHETISLSNNGETGVTLLAVLAR
ncbi:MAG TPA: cupin domain-containing protein [Terrimesophilobacter sp.]|nr:cupin domain-containing protein [Terrimesophilobacter sp.]HRP99773.1 cupin domain-containing protein [Terrimesophilobacter sp.]